MGISALRFDKLFAQSTGGWVSGLQVNPAIDNKRVICCHDPSMLTSTPRISVSAKPLGCAVANTKITAAVSIVRMLASRIVLKPRA